MEISYNIPLGKTLRFWEGLKDGKILATRCKRCAKLYFPPTADCGRCYSSEMEWIELSGEARLLAFTQITVKPMNFQAEQPYMVALAELKEGAKALAWLTDVELGEAKIGMKLRMVPKTLPDGRVTYVFKRQVEEEQKG